MSAAILVALISFLGCSIAAQAHQINLTSARLVVLPDRTVDVEIAMKGSDADRAAGTKVFDDAAGLVWSAVLAAASAPIAAYIEGRTAVLGENGASCRPGAAEVAADGDGVVVRIPWFCTGVADPLRYRSTVLTDVSPDARQQNGIVDVKLGRNFSAELGEPAQGVPVPRDQRVELVDASLRLHHAFSNELPHAAGP